MILQDERFLGVLGIAKRPYNARTTDSGQALGSLRIRDSWHFILRQFQQQYDTTVLEHSRTLEPSVQLDSIDICTVYNIYRPLREFHYLY